MDISLGKPRLDADLVDLDEGLRIEGDDGVSCLIRHASPELRHCLETLDGRHSLTGLLSRLPESEQFQARLLLTQLRGAGLLTDVVTRIERDVCLVGAGAVARLCALHLLRDPAVRLHLLGSETSARWGRPAANALRDRLVRNDARLARRISVAPPWPSFGDGWFGLVIIAAESIQPDRALTAHLIRHSIPFLPVLAHRSRASVGPLADYRGGACLHCADLTRADVDHAWPRVVERLSHDPARPQPGPARLAASLAATYAAWFLEGAHNGLRGLTLESVQSTSGLARRHWSTHPDCACCWQLPAADTLPGVHAESWHLAA